MPKKLKEECSKKFLAEAGTGTRDRVPFMLDKTGNKKIVFEKRLRIFFRKMSHSAENVKGGTLWDLSTYILLQNIKNLEGGLF